MTVSAAAGAIDGTIAAGVTVGAGQIGSRPTGITDPFLLAQSVSPQGGSLDVGTYEGGSQYGTLPGTLFLSNILIEGPGSVPPGIINALPDSVAGTISIDGAALSADGLANIALFTAGGVAVLTPVTGADGGTIALGGGVVLDNANVTAHGGTITLTNLLPSGTTSITGSAGSIVVSAGVTLDASGSWTNLQRDSSNTSEEGFAAGGSIAVLGTGSVRSCRRIGVGRVVRRHSFRRRKTDQRGRRQHRCVGGYRAGAERQPEL